MEIINHEYYVSLEIAKLLKRAGFDLETFGYYNNLGFFHRAIPHHGEMSAPTLEVAQRWLREVKNCYVGVEVFVHNLDMNNIYYTYNWIVYLYGDRYSGSDIDTTRYYEVSQEYGIKKALEIILEEGE